MVRDCDSLKSLFSVCVANHLIQQLEKLVINNCGVLENIVGKEEGLLETEPKKFVFPQLTELTLYNLHKLKSFYPGKYTLDCPSLKKLKISSCDNIKKMFASDSEVSFQETNGLGHDDITIQQPLFWIKKDTFANLEVLHTLKWNDAMNEAWQGQFPADFFCKLKKLQLNCSSYNGFSICGVQRLCNLEQLKLSDGDFIEVKLPISLRELRLYSMPKLMHLWWKEDSQTSGKAFQNLGTFPISLQNLKTLILLDCDGLKNLLSSTTAKSLVQLRSIDICQCKNLTEIVGNKGGECDAGDHHEIVFNQLTSLTLTNLSKLTSFHPGNCTMIFPSLNRVDVANCPELKMFSQGVVSTPTLSKLQIDYRDTSFYLETDDLNNIIKSLGEKRNEKKDQKSEESRTDSHCESISGE